MAGSHPAPDRFATSTGQALADVTWIDAHFEACRPEYEAMLRSIGLQRGWHVLDAGTGSGLFLPWIAELVGPSGRITALDIAPENVAAVRQRVMSWDLPCPVEVQEGTILALSYPDDHFDAIWCAATTQYLTDEEFMVALGEFRRVVKPGGLVAIKDYDVALERIRPSDPALRWRLIAALRDADHPQSRQFRGCLRAGTMRRWLERAGLDDVWQRSTPIEHWAPLKPSERQFLTNVCANALRQAEGVAIPTDDLAAWRRLCEPSSPHYLLNAPQFHRCETHVVAVGRVAAAATPRS